jgi:hypothetical protein
MFTMGRLRAAGSAQDIKRGVRLHRRSPSSIKRCIFAHEAVDDEPLPRDWINPSLANLRRTVSSQSTCSVATSWWSSLCSPRDSVRKMSEVVARAVFVVVLGVLMSARAASACDVVSVGAPAPKASDWVRTASLIVLARAGTDHAVVPPPGSGGFDADGVPLAFIDFAVLELLKGAISETSVRLPGFSSIAIDSTGIQCLMQWATPVDRVTPICTSPAASIS